MSKFTDTIKIRISAGDGGHGAVSFHREKFIPKGGPDGGDGGKGGNVIIHSSSSCSNLSHLFKDRVYRAENGRQGMGRNRHGRDGRDLIIKVPIGSEIRDDSTGDILNDMIKESEHFIAAEGGIGGKGNAFFKSSKNQAPRHAQPGKKGEERILLLNLKLIADVGLIGLPNAGKSTMLSKLTNAKPKIADYPFTTLIPNLGVVQREDGSFYTIADIPGIIEGAHRGDGLGLSFLMHIERVKVLLFLIDVTDESPGCNLDLLRKELKTYSNELLGKPYFVVLSKADLAEDAELKKRIDEIGEANVVPVSSLDGFNLSVLLNIIDDLLEL